MGRSKIIAATFSILLAFAPIKVNAGGIVVPAAAAAAAGGGSGAAAFALVGCVGSIILAAMIKEQQTGQQLTTLEAATCGLAFWLNPRRP